MEKERREKIKIIYSILKKSGYKPNLKDIISMTKEQKSNGGKCVLLSRVSTQVQDLTQQTEELKKAAYKEGYSDNDIIIIEDKESAVKLSIEERLGINKLLKTIETEDIERVIIYEISRLSRRPDVFYKVRDILIEKKIQLQVLTPGFCLLNDDGTLNDNSNLLIGIFLSMSESEGHIRKARTQRGKQRRAEEGKYNGGKIAFGYYIDNNGLYQVHPQDAEIVKKIYMMYTEQNMSFTAIAKELMATGELWHTKIDSGRTFVYTVLHNPIYATGNNKDIFYFRYHKKEQKFIIKAPKIISKEIWDKACKLNDIENPQRQPRKRDYIYYAHGIIYNDKGIRLSPTKTSCYYCTTKTYTNEGEDFFAININMIDSLLWHITKNIVESNSKEDKHKAIERLRNAQTNCFRKISTLKEKQDNLQAQIDRIEERIISGRLDEDKGNEMQETRYNEMTDNEIEISRLEDKTVSIQEEIERLGMDDERVTVTGSMDDQERKNLIQSYISTVIVSRITKYKYNVNVDGDNYLINTNIMSRKIYYDGKEIEYEYLDRFKRKYNEIIEIS